MAFFLVLLVIQIALFLVSALLAPKPDVENARPAGLGDFQVPTADETRPVPIVWGTMDIRGPNVVWYGDLKTVKITKKIKTMFSSKKVTVGYRYFIGMNLVLCYGEIDRVTRLEMSDKQASDQNIGPFPDNGLSYVIDRPSFLGGEEKGGGIVGRFQVYGGTPSQGRDSYMINRGPGNGDSDRIPGYVDIAHAVWRQGEIGEAPNVSGWIFRVTRFPSELADNFGATGDTIIRGNVNNGDANPAECLYEILTNDVWGMDLDPSDIDTDAFVAAQETLSAENHGVSMIIDSLRPGEDIISEILKQIDATLFQNSDGVFSLKLVRDDYVFDDLPIFDESNIISVDSFSRGGWSSTRNHVNIKYQDRNQDFIGTGSMAQDTANFRIQGRHLRDDQNMGGIKHRSLARDIAARELRVASFPMAKITLKMNRNAFPLVPGDVFRFQWEDLGIEDMVVRVGRIGLGLLERGEIEVECVQDIFAIGETVFGESDDTGWEEIDTTAVAATDEIVREVPRLLQNLDPDTFQQPLVPSWMMSAVSAPNDVHVQFRQFIDENAGGGFVDEGTAFAFSPSGTLTASYSLATADIDATGFTITNTTSTALLSDVSAASEIESGLNLGLIAGSAADGSEDEIFGWETITDNGDGTFTFTNIHRGLLDTQARTHAINARVYFFSDGNGISNQRPAGVTLGVKHQTETTQDKLDLGSASTLSFTGYNRIDKPHHPANFEVNGTRLPQISDIGANNAAFTWLHRTNDEGQIRDADVGSPLAQDTDVEYLLEFFDGAGVTPINSVVLDNLSPPPAGGTWLSYTYTNAQIAIDSGKTGNFAMRVEMTARLKSNGDTSLQTLTFTINVTLPGGGAFASSAPGSASLSG